MSGLPVCPATSYWHVHEHIHIQLHILDIQILKNETKWHMRWLSNTKPHRPRGMCFTHRVIRPRNLIHIPKLEGHSGHSNHSVKSMSWSLCQPEMSQRLLNKEHKWQRSLSWACLSTNVPIYPIGSYLPHPLVQFQHRSPVKWNWKHDDTIHDD